MSNSQEIMLLVIAFVIIGGIYAAGYYLHRKLKRKINNKFSEKYAQNQNNKHPQTEMKLLDLYKQD